MPACPACQFPDVADGAFTCPRCGALQRSPQTSIEVDIHVGTVEQGQVAGVVVERMGYSAREVQALIDQIHAGFQPRPFSGECPYRGLEPFEEEHANLFFGREMLVAEILRRLKSTRTLIIGGASGSGKSSLARAGVLPALKQDKSAGSDAWLYASLAPGRAPLDSLGRALSSLSGSLTPLEDFLARGKENTGLLSHWSEVLLGERRSRRLVLLVDQFEEVFTNLSEKEEEQRLAFIGQITHAVNAERSRLILLVTLRSDFISQCEAYPELNELVNRGYLQVGALSPQELVAAIERPAMQVGLSIQPELVHRIVQDMRDQAGALPLMQFALQDLFEAQVSCEHHRVLTLDGYLGRGGLAQALQRYADAAFAQLSAEEQELAKALFRGLVAPGRGAQDTRRTALLHELIPSGANSRQVEAMIRKLADARLVTTGEIPTEQAGAPSGAERTVTLAHERLLEAWPWLRRLVNEDRALILLKNEIEEDARRWDENRRDSSYLYSGTRLLATEAQLQQSRLYLSSLGLSFVQAGAARRQALQQQEQARLKAERRRNWQLPFSAIAVMALLLAAGWLGYRAWLRNQALQSAPTVHFDRAVAFLGEENSRVADVDRLLRLNLPEFDLEIHEVTNAQYCRCKRAGGCKALTYDQLEVCDRSITRLPVTNVTLAQAQQYCQWLGRRLPTEIEWEWAARGAENRIYPTGNDAPIAGQVNIWDGTNLDGVKWPVDDLSTDITPDGLLGMAGNVREWTLSRLLPYAQPDYLHSYWQVQESSSKKYYVARGGSFTSGPDSARSLSRHRAEASETLDDLGFRCLQGLSIQEFEEIVSASQ